MMVSAIGGYQRWISPHKGFTCAHNTVYRRGGCSGFGKRAFARFPFFLALAMLRVRLDECRAAAEIVRGGRNSERRNEACDAFATGCNPSCGLAAMSCDPAVGADCIGGLGCDACDIGSFV